MNAKKIYCAFFILLAVASMPCFIPVRHDAGETGMRPCISSAYADETNADSAANAAAAEDSPVLIRVMVIVLVIWAGIAFYLFHLDRKISRLEKRMEGLDGKV